MKSKRKEVRTFRCDKCTHQACTVEVEVGKRALENFLPQYCPYSDGSPGWAEADDGDRNESSRSLGSPTVDHEVRNTGKMWVVETVLDYGKGLSTKEDVQYFYNEPRAREEYDRRGGEQ